MGSTIGRAGPVGLLVCGTNDHVWLERCHTETPCPVTLPRELSNLIRPSAPQRSRAAANELGLLDVAFEVDDVHAARDTRSTDGYLLVAQHKNA